MLRPLLFGLLGTSALAAGLIFSVPAVTSPGQSGMPTGEDNQTEGADPHALEAGGNAAESRDLPVLVAPLVSENNEVVGYQSLALSLVLPEHHEPEETRPIQIAIEDSFNEWIATSTDEDRRAQFNDLLSLAKSLAKQAKQRIETTIDFDLVALQSDIFSAAETRKNLIEPRAPASPDQPTADPAH
ncbi:hypothetical protein [Notoacmeibacter ruber]|uniref:Uncharacterized protein n=1 Tax=Notoacmeibacter ruber TaxID=2670375 RepID=A0A3L7JDD5_9HYPH|nr:hypothetical protein [Notoacmeibacter ruber]RLQ88798.1 hypothetical protein D8780_11805 [Notoacmeibacter ruber]